MLPEQIPCAGRSPLTIVIPPALSGAEGTEVLGAPSSIFYLGLGFFFPVPQPLLTVLVGSLLSALCGFPSVNSMLPSLFLSLHTLRRRIIHTLSVNSYTLLLFHFFSPPPANVIPTGAARFSPPRRRLARRAA
jgi:hypothetical protein